MRRRVAIAAVAILALADDRGILGHDRTDWHFARRLGQTGKIERAAHGGGQGKGRSHGSARYRIKQGRGRIRAS
ncbi:hypothetical protein BF95_21805 [Sphingobium sp. Ant17]|nr:hypothetical protein BF95_21805 [Sphingobium sp. Ant17]